MVVKLSGYQQEIIKLLDNITFNDNLETHDEIVNIKINKISSQIRSMITE